MQSMLLQYRIAEWTLHQTHQVEGPVFESWWTLTCLTKNFLMMWYTYGDMNDKRTSQDRTNDLPEKEQSSIHWTEMILQTNKISLKYTNAILAILLPVKNEIEGTLPNSCSQAFACWIQKVKTSRMVSKYYSSVEFYWYQNIVCWNISLWHSRGTNLQNSRVQVHP